ncbi:MAG: glutamine--fructose-6-phosphate transaminase (isomerizing) [Desulfatiglandales bacterium]
MCGIVGYIGEKEAQDILLEGLKRLEYRGYDSAGVAILNGDSVEIRRSVGKLVALEGMIRQDPVAGKVGLGHTRWATHGRPSETNAHPHNAGGVIVVHNGIIENYLDLKRMLIDNGHIFGSETDTEVICHLIDHLIKEGKDFEEAVRQAMMQIRGSYAIGVIYQGEPGKLVAARNESPLIVGLGENENFIASDIPAILNHTRRVVFLDDMEMAVLQRDATVFYSVKGKRVAKETRLIEWSPVLAEKGGYRHFMQKEIFEQPRAVIDSFRGCIFEESGEVYLEEIAIPIEELNQIKRIAIVACGTSWHASLVGKFMIEELCGVPVEVDLGSEFRYRDPLVDMESLLILISQSGETADTLAAMREGKKKGAKVLAICNVLDSSLVRSSSGVIYTRAGPEIGVASTKAFTTQITVLFLFALYFARLRGTMKPDNLKEMIRELLMLPGQIQEILDQEEPIRQIARKYMHARDFLYLGRGINYPIALEGALKLKEISYIHAEGYPAGEMKHGPIALIDEEMPVVVLATRNRTYDKVLGNIEEVKARKGKVVAICHPSDSEVVNKADDVIFIPENNEFLTTILLSIPMQLLAYHVAVMKGTDVDQPRNLAKSVTVE